MWSLIILIIGLILVALELFVILNLEWVLLHLPYPHKVLEMLGLIAALAAAVSFGAAVVEGVSTGMGIQRIVSGTAFLTMAGIFFVVVGRIPKQ